MSEMKIPEGWDSEKLEHVTISYDGKRTPLNKTQRNQIQGKYPYYGASGQIDSINNFKLDGKFLLIAEDGENLNSRKKPIAYIVDGKFWINNHAHVLKSTEKVMIEYLCYYVNALNIMKFAKKQSTRPKLNKTNMNSIPIVFPTKIIQKKIVKKLDNIFTQLEEKKNDIFELQNNKSKILKYVFKNSKGFLFLSLLKSEKISNIFLKDLLTEIKLGTNQKSTYGSQGIPVLRMPNIQDGEIDYSDLKYTKFLKKDEEKYLLKKNDILVNRTNSIELVGKSAVFLREEKFAFASYIIRLRVDQTQILSDFLAIYLNSPLGKKYIESVYIKTAGQANINSKNIKNMKIELPSIESQTKILNKLKNLNSYTPILKKELINLTKQEEKTKKYLGHLTNTILNEAISGRLVN